MHLQTLEVGNSHFFSDHLKLSKFCMHDLFLRGMGQRSARCELGRSQDGVGMWDGELIYHPGYLPLEIVKLADITEPQAKVRRSQSCRHLLF